MNQIGRTCAQKPRQQKTSSCSINRGEFTGAVLAVFKSSLDGYRAAREWEREEDAETKKELVIFDDIMKIEKQLRLPTVKKNQLRKRLLETEVVTLKDIDRMEEEEREAAHCCARRWRGPRAAVRATAGGHRAATHCYLVAG